MKWFKSKRNPSVDLEEVLLDSSNLPEFNTGRMEGKRELPISRVNIYIIGVLFLCITFGYFSKIYMLQVVSGAEYAQVSENNTINESTIIAERGVVYDRTGTRLAWNESDPSDAYDFPVRAYADIRGLGQLLGYVSYPQKDNQGFFYRTEYLGRTGVESAFNETLSGGNGRQMVEVNALGDVVGEHAVAVAEPGDPITLSIDAELSQAMHDIIATSSAQAGFTSGAGAIMDIETGELIAMTSFPSYDSEVMSDGEDSEQITAYNEDERLPFLNKVTSGVYTPGSVVKPFVAYGALAENIIDPQKIIVSDGDIRVPNPYTPSQPSIFRDWRAQGPMTMREAIAFSSNVYFYTVGGGFQDQAGLGITRLHEYFTKFGLGSTTGIDIANEQTGVVPSPAWKRRVFDDDWRLGDTYFTAIGQYGFQTTPLQILRAYGALANGGTLVTPHVQRGEQTSRESLNLNANNLAVVREGMRMTVNYPGGTARSLERDDVAIAAKSGTAEIGNKNQFVNSWAAGYFPYKNPQYAFVLMMHEAPRSNTLGATTIMGSVVEWMSTHRPTYLGLPALDDTATNSVTSSSTR